MPSPRHDTINQLFREHPELAVEILRHQLGVDVPAGVPVRLESNDLNDRPSKDFQPDTVITVGSPRAPMHGIVVEVQQEKSVGDRRQLPRYAAALWLMLGCPVTVLCVCPESDAASYAEPIRTELPGFVFQPVVLTPRDVRVAQGRVAGQAKALLRVLTVRGIEVPEDARSRIHACIDTPQLDIWLDRAALATSITDLFDEQ